MESVYLVLVGFIFLMSAVTFFGTLRRPNRYGRYMKDNQENTVPATLGWLIFESPQLVAFSMAFWVTAVDPSVLAIGLFVTWQIHYIYRALLYPLRRKHKGKRFPIGGLVVGFGFNAINGVLNGWAVGQAEHLTTAWFADPRFLIGGCLFAVGWVINFEADTILVNLRRDGDGGYRIPRGGAFRWVSAANYLGEMLMWCGWACLTWTLAGLSFAVFTIANLLPRALSHHRWYRETFPDYPPDRKAVIPFLL